MLASLAQIGQQSPVVVLPGSEQRHILVDGYKRVRALERLGRDTVCATTWSLPEPEALLLERLMRNAEADSALEQGWLLRELCERFGLSLVELAKRFDKSPSWASRRLSLVRELPESIQERVRAGHLHAHAAMKFLVPLARANRAEAETLAQVCGARQMTTREIGALCAAWRGGTEATRDLILKSPEVVLRAQDEARRPKVPAAPEARLLADFGALLGIARRATRLLREGGWPTAALDELHRAAESTRLETDLFFTCCQKELQSARPEFANSHS